MGAAGGLAAQPAAKPPLLVLLDGDAKTWQGWTEAAGWRFLAGWAGVREKSIDLRIQALEARIADMKRQSPVDEGRIYLAAQGEGVAALFYVASRMPDLWAGAVALGGTARPAIDSNRLYAANTTLVPVLWLFADKTQEPLAQRLKAAGYNLEWKTEPAANPQQVFEWLSARRRDEYPASIDCETGSPAFPRCYWLAVTRFDPTQRNDVLESTRVRPVGSGAALDLGGFAWNPTDSGPGALISWLPENYKGPLKLNDRIVALGGKPVADGKAFAELMDQTTEEKPIVATVQRGKERMRVETRVVLPRREETVTARVQARYLPDIKEIQVLSRTVAGMRLTIPEAWAPAGLNWNGTDLGKADAAGCWLLEEKNQLLSAKRCP